MSLRREAFAGDGSYGPHYEGGGGTP